jgi:hypothetical protein
MARGKTTTDKDLSPKTTEPTPQSNDMINSRTNNMNTEDKDAEDVNVERANDSELGDAGVNDEKLTRYTSNRSADA